MAGRKKGQKVAPIPLAVIEAEARARYVTVEIDDFWGTGAIAAKTIFKVWCGVCGNSGRVTYRMLSHGNIGCQCESRSLWGLDPVQSTTDAIARRFQRLGIQNWRALSDFNVSFANAVRPRLDEIAAAGLGFESPSYRKTQAWPLEALEELLGGAAHRSELYARLDRPLRNDLAAGGSLERLATVYPHLADRGQQPLTEEEKEIKRLFRLYRERLAADPGCSFRDLYQGERCARHIYRDRSRQGFPLPLLFSEAVRRLDRRLDQANIPTPWIHEDPRRVLRRLMFIGRLTQRRILTATPGLPPSASMFDGTVEGSWNFTSHLDQYAQGPGLDDSELVEAIVARSPGLEWSRLATAARAERIREELLRRLGTPKVLLDHTQRDTQYGEIVAICRRENITSASALRERQGWIYKWAFKKKLIDALVRDLGWVGRYHATLADLYTISEWEAVVANLLALGGIAFHHDGLYPEQAGRRFRYDFHLPDFDRYIELRMHRVDSEAYQVRQGGTKNTAYIAARLAKDERLRAFRDRTINLELEDFYGVKFRMAFARHVVTVLRDLGILAVELDDERLATALDVADSGTRREVNERALKDYLTRGGGDAETVERLWALLEDRVYRPGALRLTRLHREPEIGSGFGPALFRSISRIGDNAFRVILPRKEARVKRGYFSDARYGHWTGALLAALRYRDGTG